MKLIVNALICFVSADQIFTIDDGDTATFLTDQQPIVTNSLSYALSDIELIKEGEGYNNTLYHDSLGVATICYGYNLQIHNSKF